ncbi:MAG: SGNH/GDSL hydrolase family protein [Verrucomicrobiota bacterium]|nr:SGNH/GDSL hydrolase family protein [Verrucomicrobiota bacterium]
MRTSQTLFIHPLLRYGCLFAMVFAVMGGKLSAGQTNLAGEVEMTTPPLVSLIGPMESLPTVSGRELVRFSNKAFRFSGAKMRSWNDGYHTNLFAISGGITGASAQLPFKVEFDTDSTEFEILTLGTGGKYRIKVGNEYVSLNIASGPPADGNFYWVRVTFPNSQLRTITLEAIGLAFGGVIVADGEQIKRPERELGPRCIILGDSFTEGLGSYAQRLATVMNWEVWGSGVGGTGYINAGPGGRVKFADRVQADVIANNPEIVIVAGGINDAAFSRDSIFNAATALYDLLLTNLPNTRIVVIGPWWSRGNPPDFLLRARDAVRDAAQSRSLLFIDPVVGQNTGWITGTGNIAEPQGDGNADIYISSDSTHPTDLGHQYLAVRLGAELQTLTFENPAPTIDVISLAGVLIHGQVGRTYTIQQKAQLALPDWGSLTNLTLSSNSELWVDTGSETNASTIYRAVLIP